MDISYPENLPVILQIFDVLLGVVFFRWKSFYGHSSKGGPKKDVDIQVLFFCFSDMRLGRIQINTSVFFSCSVRGV